jgi:hypothetical protein
LGNTVYGVTYPGGASGQFIKSMLVYILSDDDINMDFNDGSSHWYYRKYLQSKPELSILSSKNNSTPEKYNIIANINSTSPLIDTPPINLNLQKIYNCGLDYKFIFIYIDVDDLFIVNANHYYKQPNTIPYYLELSNKLFSISDLSTLSSTQEKILINHPDMLGVYTNGYLSTINKWLSDYSEQLPNSLYQIDFKDIVNNSNKVKIILENITNKKLSIHAHRQYDRYVERQLEFRKEKGLL